MKTLIFSIFAILLSSTSCGHAPKLKPEHIGVHKEFKSYVEEFKALATQKNIAFKKDVTIGFTKINSDTVIGTCTYGMGWREIDIDSDYWLFANNRSRNALMFHELVHCYCGRNHDWGDGKRYPSKLEQRIKQALDWLKLGGEKQGYLDDGCPSTIMYPVIADNECWTTHYSEYLDEMLNRCNPY